jgi:hypothetical protein
MHGKVRTSAVVLSVGLAVAACGPKAPPAGAPAPEPPPASRDAQVVNGTILTNGCRDLGPSAAHLAEGAMYQLIEGCAAVPGGKAQFGATLQPGGRIEIAGVAGQPDVVPICVLKHSLRHNVPLTKPCRLDVKIEQTSVSVLIDAGAG